MLIMARIVNHSLHTSVMAVRRDMGLDRGHCASGSGSPLSSVGGMTSLVRKTTVEEVSLSVGYLQCVPAVLVR